MLSHHGGWRPGVQGVWRRGAEIRRPQLRGGDRSGRRPSGAAFRVKHNNYLIFNGYFL